MGQREVQERESLERKFGIALPRNFQNCSRHHLGFRGAECACVRGLTPAELEEVGRAVARHLLEQAGYVDRYAFEIPIVDCPNCREDAVCRECDEPIMNSEGTGAAAKLAAVVEIASHGYEPGRAFAEALQRALAERGYEVTRRVQP